MDRLPLIEVLLAAPLEYFEFDKNRFTPPCGTKDMRRRAYLRAAGLAATVGIAGCLGDDSTPEAANEFGYETDTTEGVEVPLVPVQDSIEWYRDESAAFVDARSHTAFEKARIAGAVFSPAPDGQESDDPVSDVARR